MTKTFYQFLMKYRQLNSKEQLALFANHVYEDHSFPKHETDYDKLSTYLELNGYYLSSMTIFDHAWELYLLNEVK